MSLEHYFLDIPFEIDTLNQKYKQQMLDQFSAYEKLQQQGLASINNINCEFVQPVYTRIIHRLWCHTVHSLFDVDTQIGTTRCWIAVQDHNKKFRPWHNHAKTATINAVFYCDPPSQGGELALWFLNQEHRIPVQSNRLYIFPYWMEHRALPQTSQWSRISINTEYLCRSRPVVKRTGVVW